jgi:CubicO group peptidase (beta-lactamase class C family)
MKYNQFLVLVILIVIQCVVTKAQIYQDEIREILRLEHVTTIERDMGRDDVHAYKINLDKGTFFYARIEQRGIDILVKIYDPDKNLVDEVDSPTGDRGTEEIILVTEKRGDYTLEVHPFDPLTKDGQYFLSVEKIAATATTISGKIDQLFVPWDKKDSPGAAVAVVKEGKVVFKKGYGMANLEYDIPITPSTIFHMASVSKQFTAFAIATLAQQGKISLDDRIQTYLPEIPDFGKKITVRHLVHHTSGLRDQWSLLMLAGWRLDDVITKDHIFKLVSRQKELNFTPGDEHMYSNTGYTLMAEIVSRVSGKSFAEWTKENIFDPLNMNHTLFYDDHEKIVKNRAYSYYGDKTNGFKKSVLSYANVGATSLFTSAEDLAKWAINFDYPIVGNQVLFDQMEQRGVLNNGDTIAYAFGQGVGVYKGLKFISHSGGDAGYRAHLRRFPDQKFSVMVMSNFGAFNPGAMTQKIADIYLENLYAEEQTEEKPKPDFATVEVDPLILEKYTGLYEMESGERFSIRRDGVFLNIRPANQSWETLYAINETTFMTEDSRSECSFQIDLEGEVQEMTVKHNEEVFITKKVKPLRLSQEQLQNYAGSYYSDELETTYTVFVKDSVLAIRHQRHPDFTLRPERHDVFNGVGVFGGQLVFERNDDKMITGFRVNTGRVRNLLFEKQKNKME